MPLIDYKCEICKEEYFEIVRSDNSIVICPKCGSKESKRTYKGKYYGKNGVSCSGSCSACSGCR